MKSPIPIACLLVSCFWALTVQGHGVLLQPISRAVRLAANTTNGAAVAGNCPGFACEWYTQQSTVPAHLPTTNCDRTLRTMGVSCDSENPTDFPCSPGAAAPWCTPGRAPVKSPCGVFAGGLHRNTRDMLDLPNEPQAVWHAGAEAEVMFAITANHGGGYAYRLCRLPANGDKPSEECFQSGHLQFAGPTQWLVDTQGQIIANMTAVRTSKGTYPPQSQWTRNPVPQETFFPSPAGVPGGRGPFPFSVMDRVEVPRTLSSGHYVLSWRWDAEQTKQVWSHCSDVTVVNPDEPPPPAPAPAPTNVCVGKSIGLEVNECAAWIDLYDALDGAHWPETWSEGCDGRLDPCGCSTSWKKSIRCNGVRDYMHLSEIYLLGSQVSGVLPSSIAHLTQLKALSFVDTKIRGELPESMGTMYNLVYVWLDHNPLLGGEIPSSFLNMTQLYAFELHYSNFSGKLPRLQWANIADCALQGNVFDCPLPEGSQTCGASCK